jgi:hypothetical protein
MVWFSCEKDQYRENANEAHGENIMVDGDIAKKFVFPS